MNQILSLLLLGMSLSSVAQPAKPIFPTPLSPRLANYQIDVTLDPVSKKINGRETLTWRNPSNDVIRELQFHLYLNAFRNERSTFMRESGGQLRGAVIDRNAKENPYGSIDIVSMSRRSGQSAGNAPGTSEPLAYQFIQPDDQAAGTQNKDDHTVIRVPLSKPVGPGETVVLDIAFQAKLPKIFARTGFSRDFFLVGQWFPKIGVYEPAGTRYAKVGQWNCHQFHANSEFYADYGVYDVNITTPKAYWVSATGLYQSEKLHSNGTKTILYHAEDVVDFAWTASPHFKVIEDKWKRPDGGFVSLELVMQPEHAHQAQRHLDAIKAALAYFDKHLGKYPFPNLTIVDPPFHAQGSFGMEYPTFITAGSAWFLPAGARFPEEVTIHEFGHQYFMQLLATNEFEEAWLDEGFNQYYEGRIMDATYGARSSQIDLLGFGMGDLESSRDSYVHQDNPAIGSSFGNTWQLPEGQYGVLTYSKTATWLRTLEGLAGRPVMDEIMQTYFNRWKFKHPDGQNFIDIVNELVPKRLGTKYGPDMNWFFDQVLYGDKVIDYELISLKNRTQAGRKQSVITVQRNGDGTMPVDVLVHFDNGRELLLFWDGKGRQRQFTVTENAKAVWANVDPKQRIYMDTNLNNNSLTLTPSSAPAAKFATKFLFWIENWMQWLAWLA
ncbi:M1 family metallopeptidase [Spirosoma radiotolerans]|uniref:Peptidase M1 n=1 Tax=Spirosoma radiotolerans TaxID=1379870 RepID=A0A0E3ZY84_9BACT|nr:M1 family metallopeptidase [Spirosoma radiotolerans]AKD57303.1 peptidase M1 [Spirosoma radiotolerans]